MLAITKWMLDFDISWPILEVLHRSELGDNLRSKMLYVAQAQKNIFVYEISLDGDFENSLISERLKGSWIAFDCRRVKVYKAAQFHDAILKRLNEGSLLHRTKEEALKNALRISP